MYHPRYNFIQRETSPVLYPHIVKKTFIRLYSLSRVEPLITLPINALTGLSLFSISIDKRNIEYRTINKNNYCTNRNFILML